MSWVLIWVLSTYSSSGGLATGSQVFANKTLCESAALEVRKMAGIATSVTTRCVLQGQ